MAILTSFSIAVQDFKQPYPIGEAMKGNQRLSALGIPTEFHVYEGLGHAFGIGTGTVAEGWVKDAIDFWKANMNQEPDSGVPPVYAD